MILRWPRSAGVCLLQAPGGIRFLKHLAHSDSFAIKIITNALERLFEPS
jgi:hypothetical protein